MKEMVRKMPLSSDVENLAASFRAVSAYRRREEDGSELARRGAVVYKRVFQPATLPVVLNAEEDVFLRRVLLEAAGATITEGDVEYYDPDKLVRVQGEMVAELEERGIVKFAAPTQGLS